MKVRAILDYKGLEFQRVNPLSVLHSLRRRGTGKVPGVEIDGIFVTDSTDIAYALDERWPAPPLHPPSEHERGLCHAIEEWADESLYFIGLYYRWYEAEGRKPIAGVFGSSLKGRLAYRFYLRRILGQIRGQGTLRKTPEHVARDLQRHLDAFQDLVEPGPYVLGDKPYLCDFALWGQLNYLNRTPVGGRAIMQRPAVARYVDLIGSRSTGTA
jgi:glutathione S-transferase